jgi:hypothetical protein
MASSEDFPVVSAPLPARYQGAFRSAYSSWLRRSRVPPHRCRAAEDAITLGRSIFEGVEGILYENQLTGLAAWHEWTGDDADLVSIAEEVAESDLADLRDQRLWN